MKKLDVLRREHSQRMWPLLHIPGVVLGPDVSMRFQSRGGSRESIAGRFWFTGRNPFVTVGAGELGSPWGLSAEGVCTGLWLREVSPPLGPPFLAWSRMTPLFLPCAVWGPCPPCHFRLLRKLPLGGSEQASQCLSMACYKA